MRKHDYLFNRRGYVANTKLDPLVGKSPASAGIPPKATQSTALASQSLLKGNGLYSKKFNQPESKPKEFPAPTPPKASPVDELITIHVTDERK